MEYRAVVEELWGRTVTAVVIYRTPKGPRVLTKPGRFLATLGTLARLQNDISSELLIGATTRVSETHEAPPDPVTGVAAFKLKKPTWQDKEDLSLATVDELANSLLANWDEVVVAVTKDSEDGDTLVNASYWHGRPIICLGMLSLAMTYLIKDRRSALNPDQDVEPTEWTQYPVHVWAGCGPEEVGLTGVGNPMERAGLIALLNYQTLQQDPWS